MKISDIQKIITEITPFLENASVLKPVLGHILTLAEDFAVEIEPTLNKMREYAIDSRIASINQYKAAGFSHEDAILMTLDGVQRYKLYIDNLIKNSK